MAKKKQDSPDREERRQLALADLEEFIKLIHPKRWLGNVHRELISWWCRQEAKSHQLVLLPRDHMKSTLIAYRVAWEITKNPAIRVLYISSTSNLATKQLKFIKDILTNDTYRAYWPDMVISEEARREKWTEREISVDHPRRKEEYIREPTVFTAGLTTNIVGLHCDVAVLDDVVVASNAYLEDNREKVKEQYGYLSSVEGTGAREWIVGTRYHPNDLYADLVGLELERYDDQGDLIDGEFDQLFEVFERQVESAGDGTGQYLWPRTKYPDGKWFGFNAQILSTKKLQYTNKFHFRAQYYNDPNDVESSPIQRDFFQYYDENYLSYKDGRWFFKGKPLNIFAAVDFAYSFGQKSDFTAIAVVGVTGDHDYYVLEIDRFKTDRIAEYYTRIFKLHDKWGFRKIRAEVTAAQAVIARDLKENYIRKQGLALSIDEYRPTKWEGVKAERIRAILQPRYENRQVWHYRSGFCQALEEELIFTNPSHDDLKDALAQAIDVSTAPSNSFAKHAKTQAFQYHGRFGGVL